MAKRTEVQLAVSRMTPFDRLPVWLSAKEIARFLEIPLSTAYLTIRRLPRRRFGRHLRVSREHFKPSRSRS